MTPRKQLGEEPVTKGPDDVVLKAALGLAHAFTVLVSGIGLPGAVFLTVAYFFIKSATDAQKEEFINLFFLGKWNGRPVLGLVITAIFVLFILVQRYYYKYKVLILKTEIDRLGSEKSKAQAQKIGKPLNSSSNKKRKET